MKILATILKLNLTISPLQCVVTITYKGDGNLGEVNQG